MEAAILANWLMALHITQQTETLLLCYGPALSENLLHIRERRALALHCWPVFASQSLQALMNYTAIYNEVLTGKLLQLILKASQKVATLERQEMHAL